MCERGKDVWVGRWPELKPLGRSIYCHSNDKVSFGIIIPCFKSEQYIVKTVRSALECCGPHDRVYIVFNGDFEKSKHAVQGAFLKTDKLVSIELSEANAAAARNAGIRNALGHDYIAFLDSDDIWRRDKLDKIRWLLYRQKLDIIAHKSSSFCSVKEGKSVISEILSKRRPSERTLLKQLVVRGNMFETSSVVLSRSLVEGIDLFDKRLRYTQDYEAWCKIASIKQDIELGYIDEPLSMIRLENGLSKRFMRRIVNIAKIRLRYSKHLTVLELVRSGCCWVFSSLGILLRWVRVI